MTLEEFKATLLDPNTQIKRNPPETIAFQEKLKSLPDNCWKWMYENYYTKGEIGEYFAMNCIVSYVNNWLNNHKDFKNTWASI